MYKIHVILIVLMIIGVINGKAHALLWYGVGSICFEGDWTGGGKAEEGTLEIDLVNVLVEAACHPPGNDREWFPGEAHDGSEFVEVDWVADPDGNGHIHVEGCISTERYDQHSLPNHIHLCGGEGQIEIQGSAIVPQISVDWVLLDFRGRVIRRGTQDCFWPSGRDPETGLPINNPDGSLIQFECPVDEEFRR